MKQQITRPNIFKVSTKELSQDAFIVWLLQWADPRCAELDVTLHECGKAFLQLVMGSGFQKERHISQINAGRQWGHIDVWAEIHFTDKTKTLLVLEDKTFTDEHSNQLERYKKQAEEYCTKNEFSLICCYFKIGSEPASTLRAIREKGFHIVTRKEIIETLQSYRQTEHSILRDFVDYIDYVEEAHIAFELLPLKDWKGSAWVGFYQFIESNIEIVKWHWVNNPGGGFWNLCLTWEYWNSCVPVYLQIEEQKLCFKIAVGEDETGFDSSVTDVTAMKDCVTKALIDFVGADNPWKIKRKGAGRGNYRTFASIDQQDWCGNLDSKLDRAYVVSRLQDILGFYQRFMHFLNKKSFEAAGITVQREKVE